MDDDDLRTLALWLARGRVAIGAVLLVAPGTSGRVWLGADSAGTGARVLARTTGARDAILGMGASIAVRSRTREADWLSMGALADAADAAILFGSRGLPRRARLVGALAAAAAVTHFVLARRLAPPDVPVSSA